MKEKRRLQLSVNEKVIEESKILLKDSLKVNHIVITPEQLIIQTTSIIEQKEKMSSD
jgi:hypothetical protein